MLNHYYTLSKVAEELKSLNGSKVIECFSQEKNVLMIELLSNEGVHYLQICTDSQSGTLFMRKRFNRSRSNSVDLFPELAGNILKNVKIDKNDRVVRFDFGERTLNVVLFGGSRNNIFLANQDGITTDAFKSKEKFQGRISLLLDEIESKANFKTRGISPMLSDYFSKGFPYLGRYYIKEFFDIMKLEKSSETDSLSEEQLQLLTDKAAGFRDEILRSKDFYILENDKGEFILSLIKLSDYPVVTFKTSSISEAIEKRLVKKIISGKIENLRYKALTILDRKKNHSEQKLNQIRNTGESEARAEKYRNWAELLLTHPEQKIKPGKEITIPDFNGNSIVIPLQPNLTVNENSVRYYNKASNIMSSLTFLNSKCEYYIREMEIANEAMFKFINSVNMKEIEKLMEEYKDLLNIQEPGKETAKKFREFNLGEGYILYVGKSAASNDELTLKFAKPNDLWLHARGTSGSHAVLRLNKNEKPPKHILQRAASITAYYSGARNAKYVPVCYTYKKYVHKPKGTNPGSVVLSKEEVIMAEPKLYNEE